MITSVTEKFRSYIFPANSRTSDFETPSKKRKRPFDAEDPGAASGDPDVEIISVKRARQNSVFSIFSSPVNKMAHWLRQKSSFSKDYFFKQVDEQPPKFNVPPDLHYRNKSSILTTTNGKNWKTETFASQKSVPTSHKNVVPPQKVKRSYRDVLASSSYVPQTQTNGQFDEARQACKKQSVSKEPLFSNGSSTSSTSLKPPTAQLCVRLDEKEKYRQLLQQFTSTPLDSSRHKKNTKTSNTSFFDKSSRNGSSYFGESRKSSVKQHPVMKAKDPLSVSSTYLSKHHKTAVELLASAPSLPIIDTSRIMESPPISAAEDDSEKITPFVCETSFQDLTSPTFEKIEQSLYIRDDWLKEFKVNKNLDKEERDKKIAVVEVTVKVHHEWRKKHDEDFEKNLQEQMRALEPFTEEVKDEEEISELPELTEDMNDVIENALNGSSQKIIAEGFKLQLTRADIVTLEGLNWLNDEVINFYMNLLMQRGEGDNMAKVHVFNTFFYPKLISAGHTALRRWTKRVDVLAVDYILVPVHLGMHWCLAVVNFRKKCVEYYDSMGSNNNKCLNALRQYLCDESLDKKKQKFDLSGWESINVKKIPQQMNGSDCGMFSCKYAEYITRGAEITFTQEDMPYFRSRMIYEIVSKKLLQ